MANFWSLRVRIRSMSRVCVWLRQKMAHAFLNVSPCSTSNCNETHPPVYVMLNITTLRVFIVLFVDVNVTEKPRLYTLT